MGEANQYFKDIQIVGDIRQAMQRLHDYLGEAPTLQLSTEALAKFHELEKQYDEFYELSLDERLVKSGINASPQIDKDSNE